MVNRNERRYCPASAPAIGEGPEYPLAAGAPEIAFCATTVNVMPMDREAYEERAAIVEYDGGLSRDEAERKALALAIQAQELQAAGWDLWNASARAESEALPGWKRAP